MFAVSAQDKVGTSVHQLIAFIAAVLGVFCFATFFFLIDYALRILRPIGILPSVGSAGLSVIETMYPNLSCGLDVPERQRHPLGQPNRIISHRGTSEIVLAVNLKPLIAEAG